MEIRIIQENNQYLLIWKEQGIPVVPKNNETYSLISELVKIKPELKNVNGYKPNEFGLINRLDNQTGGIVIVAKNNESFDRLKSLMKNEKIEKSYLAYSYNLGEKKKGIIDNPIAHHKRKKKKMVLAQNPNQYRGKPQYCYTYFELINNENARIIWDNYLNGKVPFPNIEIKNRKDFTWILCKIRKGKRHQIRIHLKSIGYPILFDDLYYSKRFRMKNEDNENHKLFSIGVNLLEKFNKN